MKTSLKSLRVLIAAGNRDFLAVARAWLRQHAAIGEVTAVDSAAKLLREVSLRERDLVLVDAALPEMDGFEVTRQIKGDPNAPPVVILVLFGSEAVRREAAAAGADACIDKSAFTREISPILGGLVPGTDPLRPPGTGS